MSLECAFNLCTHRSLICGGIDDGKPPRFPACQIQVSRPDALVEKQLLLFEAGLHHMGRIGIDPAPGAGQSGFGLQIEQQGQIGRQALAGQVVQLANHVFVQTPGIALVDQGGIEIAIAHHHLARCQRRTNDRLQMLDPVRHVKQQFGRRRQIAVVRVEQDGTNLTADGRTAGFPGGQAVTAGRRQPSGNGLDLGGFPRAFNAF